MNNIPEEKDFFKTFVNSADALFKGLEIEDSTNLKFRTNVGLLIKLYPAMVNAAQELNVHYGYKIRIPAREPDEAFDKIDLLYSLYQKVSEAANGDKKLKMAIPVYDVADKQWVSGLDNVIENVNRKGGLSERYWLKNALLCTQILSSELQDEETSKIKIRQEEAELADKLVSSMVKNGIEVDTSKKDYFIEAFEDASQKLLVMPIKLNHDIIKHELLKSLKRSCDIDRKDKKTVSSVETVMDDYVASIKKSRPLMRKQSRDMKKSMEAIRSMKGNVSDEDVAEDIKLRKIDGEFGISREKVNVPETHNLKKVFVNPITNRKINKLAAEEKDSEEEKWYNYKTAKITNPEIKAEIKKLVGNWVDEASREMYMARDTFEVIRSYDEENSNDDEDDDDEEGDGDWSGLIDSENKIEQDMINDDKVSLVKYAEEVAALSAASDKYLNVILNDSAVSLNVIKKIDPAGEWGNVEYNSLYALLEAIENNSYEKQDLILSEIGKADEDFLDLLHEEPSSLEKKAMLETLMGVYARMEVTRAEYKVDSEADLADLLQEEHQKEYQILEDYLRLGAENYSGLNDLVIEHMADEINVGVCTHYILPIYDNEPKDERAFDLVMDNILDYEELSEPEQKFLQKLTTKYIESLEAVHKEKHSDRNCDRKIYAQIEEYKEQVDELDGVSNLLMQTALLLSKENSIHDQYLEFEKGEKKRYPSRMAMLRNMKNSKLCNN